MTAQFVSELKKEKKKLIGWCEITLLKALWERLRELGTVGENPFFKNKSRLECSRPKYADNRRE